MLLRPVVNVGNVLQFFRSPIEIKTCVGLPDYLGIFSRNGQYLGEQKFLIPVAKHVGEYVHPIAARDELEWRASLVHQEMMVSLDTSFTNEETASSNQLISRSVGPDIEIL